MNSKVIIGVVVAVVIVLGLWLMFGPERAAAPTPAGTDADQTTAAVESKSNSNVGESFTGMGSFLELMGMGRNLVCDFNYVADDTDGTVAGTVKISRDRMRGDYEMVQAGEVYTSHMIQDAGYMYTWSETPDGTFGMKMLIPDDPETGLYEESPTELGRSVSLDNEVEYSCRPWGVANEDFIPPTDVEFMDMEKMMEGFMPEGMSLPMSN